MEIQKIETWLPLFPGFYGTIFESDCDNELYNQNSDRGYLPKIEWDDLDFDNKTYEEEVAKQFTSQVEGLLQELKLLTSIEIENISRPREYNFQNDSINIIVYLTEEETKNIQAYIYQNNKKYEKYLKEQYTSYSGFWSHYGNSFEEWQDYTNDFTDFSGNGHYLGSILEFVCKNEGWADEDIYYGLVDVHESNYCQNREGQMKCESCGEWYEAKHPELKEYENTLEKQTTLWNETQVGKPLKTKTFKETYSDFKFLCNNCKE